MIEAVPAPIAIELAETATGPLAEVDLVECRRHCDGTFPARGDGLCCFAGALLWAAKDAVEMHVRENRRQPCRLRSSFLIEVYARAATDQLMPKQIVLGVADEMKD